jgi:hypothetical protein
MSIIKQQKVLEMLFVIFCKLQDPKNTPHRVAMKNSLSLQRFVTFFILQKTTLTEPVTYIFTERSPCLSTFYAKFYYHISLLSHIAERIPLLWKQKITNNISNTFCCFIIDIKTQPYFGHVFDSRAV